MYNIKLGFPLRLLMSTNWYGEFTKKIAQEIEYFLLLFSIIIINSKFLNKILCIIIITNCVCLFQA